jgi:outer membrane protein OmpA-like peptidoglycan-associated protein
MKPTLLIAATFGLCCFSLYTTAQVNDPGQVAKDATTNHANNDMSNAADNGLNKAENGVKNLFKKKNKPAATAQPNSAATTDAASANQQTGSIKTYQNYDFVPGDKILFEDHFTDDQDGEFPAHWELLKGQGVVNKLNGEETFSLTDGNYVIVIPRMKTANYLTDPFTIEYDTYFPEGSYGLNVFFNRATTDADQDASLSINSGDISFDADNNALHLDAAQPAALLEANYVNKWHHIALAYKNKQLKVYIDQFRVLTIPDMHVIPAKVLFGGLASQDAPLIFKNVRIASGGNMNMIGKKFTESKIVTHGINFDVDKATIKPESMGTLNMIVGVMKDNPDIKFEVDGHTDNTGNAQHNLTLSQQRADAVRTQLISMGIDASRLTTKGFGDTKPISDNNTLEGKANNRRVEFVKM